MKRYSLGIAFAFLIASVATVSGHMVKGLIHDTLATAFIASPTVSGDATIPISWGSAPGPVLDTGLRVACFHANNTTTPRADDPDWPRITAVGFELPGRLEGFALLSPLDGEWDLVEGAQVSVPNHEKVTLDFALVSRRDRDGKWDKKPRAVDGIPPGQPAERGKGQQFCVSGPFPPTLLIEKIIDGVVVRFRGVERGRSIDVGVWHNPGPRPIPLYPE